MAEVGSRMREPIESMRDALWEIERLEEKLEEDEDDD